MSGRVWLPLGVLSKNFACNSPAPVSSRTFTSLELQRLWKLLKVHSIELHAKLLRASASNAIAGPLRRRLTAGRLTLVHLRTRGPANSHVNRLIRAWASSFARWPTNTSVGSPAQTRNSGLTCEIAG